MVKIEYPNYFKSRNTWEEHETRMTNTDGTFSWKKGEKWILKEEENLPDKRKNNQALARTKI